MIANVGDSRAYLLRDDDLRRISEDHSVVAELVAAGQISEAEAAVHPQRTVITRVLGAEPTVQVDLFSVDTAGRHDPALLRRPDDDGARGRVARLLAAGGSCEQIAQC